MVILLQLARSMQLAPIPLISNCESTWLLTPFKEIAGEEVNVVDEVVGVLAIVVGVVVGVGLEKFFLLYDAALACRLGELAVAPKLF
jgi:hypothetical protein